MSPPQSAIPWLLEERKEHCRLNCKGKRGVSLVDVSFGSNGRTPYLEATEGGSTQRTKAELEAQIRRAAREWQETIDAVESPVILLGWTGIVQRLNRAALELLGGTFGDWIGRSLPVNGEEPWTSISTLLDQVKDSWRSAATQILDGQSRSWHAVANLTQTTKNSKPPRIVLSLRDVSEVVRLERSLRRSEKLSALGQLLGGVAHEARNPLFGISATLDALESAGEPTELIPVLRGEVRRLQRLMDDLLEYGKPSSGRRKTCLTEIIERAVASFRSAGGSRAVARIEVVAPRHLPRILVDPERLERVVLNLLSNAEIHSPPGGEIRIVCGVETAAGRAWLVCEVEDAGPGIREEDLEHIWEPFYSRRPGGTGLGLSIVQRIVEEHGGSVAAENRLRGGARMQLRFPTCCCLQSSGDDGGL